MNSKGFKDLKKNRKSTLLLDINYYYKSCPEDDEDSESELLSPKEYSNYIGKLKSKELLDRNSTHFQEQNKVTDEANYDSIENINNQDKGNKDDIFKKTSILKKYNEQNKSSKSYKGNNIKAIENLPYLEDDYLQNLKSNDNANAISNLRLSFKINEQLIKDEENFSSKDCSYALKLFRKKTEEMTLEKNIMEKTINNNVSKKNVLHSSTIKKHKLNLDLKVEKFNLVKNEEDLDLNNKCQSYCSESFLKISTKSSSILSKLEAIRKNSVSSLLLNNNASS